MGVRKRVVLLLNSTVVALQQGQAARKENHYCPAWAGRRSELCVENCSSQCGLELSEKILLLASLVAELQEFEFCSGRAAGISVLHCVAGEKNNSALAGWRKNKFVSESVLARWRKCCALLGWEWEGKMCCVAPHTEN